MFSNVSDLMTKEGTQQAMPKGGLLDAIPDRLATKNLDGMDGVAVLGELFLSFRQRGRAYTPQSKAVKVLGLRSLRRYACAVISSPGYSRCQK